MITNFKIFENEKNKAPASRFKLIATSFKNLFKEYNSVKIYNFFSPIFINSIGTILLNSSRKYKSILEIIFQMNSNYKDFPTFFQHFLDKEEIQYKITKDDYKGKNEYYFEIDTIYMKKITEVIDDMKDDFKTYMDSKKYNL